MSLFSARASWPSLQHQIPGKVCAHIGHFFTLSNENQICQPFSMLVFMFDAWIPESSRQGGLISNATVPIQSVPLPPRLPAHDSFRLGDKLSM